MFHVIGIDAGGSKTVCLLADDQGTIISRGQGSGANLQSMGELQVEKVVHEVMEQAIGERDVVPSIICIGIAGVDRPDDRAIVRGIMRRIGFKARIVIVNDALIALEAGAPGEPGIVIISGTGSIAYGRNAAGEAARSGGWGYALGDEGSGYWIGRAALRAVLRAADHRGPATVLTAMLLEHFGVPQPQALLHQVYQQNLKPAAISTLAACVQRAIGEDDEAALAILRGAANELEGAALSVARRLELLEEPFAFILSGGVFRAVPSLHEELARRFQASAPLSATKLIDREPAEGALRFALQESRGGARVPMYKH
jgi:N-acetylglucosamine kinase